MNNKEIHEMLEVALTLKIPITAVLVDVEIIGPDLPPTSATVSHIEMGVGIPPEHAKTLLLDQLPHGLSEVYILHGGVSFHQMVEAGADALGRSLRNLLQAMGGKGNYEAVVADLRQMDDALDPSSELETLVFAENILSEALGIASLNISLSSFIMEWGKLHDHLDGGSRESGISIHLVEGEPDAATAEDLVYAFSLSNNIRGAQPAVDTPACVRAAAVDVQAFMFRGLLDVLHCLCDATESVAVIQYITESANHE